MAVRAVSIVIVISVEGKDNKITLRGSPANQAYRLGRASAVIGGRIYESPLALAVVEFTRRC